jgi:hypothetical protein
MAMIPGTGVAGALVKISSARPAGLTLRSAAGLVLLGLGVGAGVITGKSPAAFPAPTTVMTFGSGRSPGMAAVWMVPKRLAGLPGPMSELVALFGFGRGPRGRAPAEDSENAECVALALAVAEPELVELAVAAGLEDAEGVGAGDVEGAELALGVGAGDVERVGLGVDVGGGDVEGAGLSLVPGADIDGDGLGVLESLGPGLVLPAAGEGGEGEATALASAGSCELTDSPETRKPPVTRPATTARRCATGI